MTLCIAYSSRVTIGVFDASGRAIVNLDSGVLKAGRHEFGPYRYVPTPGIYFCRVTAGKTTQTVKLVKAG